MADETKKKITYLNLELDEDFVNFSGQHADAYTGHKNMNASLRDAFLLELNRRHANMLNGIDGSIANNTDNTYTGALTGRAKDGPVAWNGMARDSFNAAREVDNYLMGVRGRYTLLKGLQAKVAEEKPVLNKFTAHTGEGGSSLGGALKRKLWGNNLNMTDWADGVGDIFLDGARSLNGRYLAMDKALSEYRDDLANGKYGDLTDEMQGEIAMIDKALQSTDPTARAAAYKALLGNNMYDSMFFSGEQYQTPEEAAAAKAEADADANIDMKNKYINGEEGAVNPYEKGTAEYEAVEKLREQNAKNKWESDFKSGKFFNYASDGKENWHSVYTDAIDESVFDDITPEEMAGWLSEMNGVQNYGGGYDVHTKWWKTPKELGHTDTSGYNTDNWYSEDADLKDTNLGGYLQYQISHDTDLAADDVISEGAFSGNRMRSNRAIRALAALDYVRQRIMKDKAKYEVAPGLYILPEFINWDTGLASLFSFGLQNIGNAVRGVTRQKYINIGTLLNNLAETNPTLYNELIGLYYKRQQKLGKLALGGILKAASGYVLTDKERQSLNNDFLRIGNPTLNVDWFSTDPSYQRVVGNKEIKESQRRYDKANAEGPEAVAVEDRNNSTTFLALDYARLGTAVADLTGAVLSLSGFSLAGAAVGGASTLTQFGLDIADKDVSITDALKGLGVGLALDAATLIPVGGAFGGVAKAAKVLTKYSVPIISALQVMGNQELAIATAKKVFSGNFSGITVGEWKGFCKALNGITNATPMAKVAYAKRFGKLKDLKTPEASKSWQYEINGKKVELTAEEAKNINFDLFKAKFAEGEGALNEEALNAIKEQEWFGRNRLKFWNKENSLNLAKGTAVTKEGDMSLYNAAIEALYNQGLAQTGWRGRLAQAGMTDADMALGGRGALKLKYNAIQKAQAEKELAAIEQLEANGYEKYDKAAINAKKKALQDRLVALEQEYLALGGDAALASLTAQAKDMDGNAFGRAKRMLELRKGKLDKLTAANKEVARQQGLLNEYKTAEMASQEYKVLEGDLKAAMAIRDEIATKLSDPKLTPAQRSLLNKDHVDANRMVKEAEDKINLDFWGSRQAKMDEITNNANAAISELNALIAKLNKHLSAIEQAGINYANKSGFEGINTSAVHQTPWERLVASFESNYATHPENNDKAFKAMVEKAVNVKKQMLSMQKTKDRLTNMPAAIDKHYKNMHKQLTKPSEKLYANDVKAGYAAKLYKDIPIANQAKFEKLLQDLKRLGYNDVTIRRILHNADEMKRLRAVYGFRQGGQMLPKALLGFQFPKWSPTISATGQVTSTLPNYFKTSPGLSIIDGMQNTINTNNLTMAAATAGFKTRPATVGTESQIEVEREKNGWSPEVLKKGMSALSSLGTSNNMISALETTKKFLNDADNKKILDSLLDTKPFQATPVTYNYTVATGLADLPYLQAASKAMTTANRIANNTANAELGALALMQGANQANLYSLLGALAIRQQNNLELAKANQIGQNNAKAANDALNYNGKLLNAKEQADASAMLLYIHLKGTANQQFLTQIQNGIGTSALNGYLTDMAIARNNNKQYKELFDAYNNAKVAYANATDTASKKLAKDALTKATNDLSNYTTTWNNTYLAENPFVGNVPFSYAKSYTPYKGDFFGTLYAQGGKMEAAEKKRNEGKLITEHGRDKERYMKIMKHYMDLSLKNLHTSGNAYNAYLKMLSK